MGKATIIESLGAGLYTVQRDYGAEKLAALVAVLDQRIADQVIAIEALDSRISELDAKAEAATEAFEAAQSDLALAATAESPAPEAQMKAFEEAIKALNEITGEKQGVSTQRNLANLLKLDLEKRKAAILAAEPPESDLVWCADYSEGVTGTVPTIEISGELSTNLPANPALPTEPQAVKFVVAPRDRETPEWQGHIDGQMMPREWMSPEQAFFNAAILPGWQRHEPTYRAGKITAISVSTGTCDLELLPIKSTAQDLIINQSDVLTNVPVRYMTCDIEAFALDDLVVVEFQARDWLQPRVIGFVHHPRECRAGRLVWMPEGFHLWPRNTDAPKGWGLPVVDGVRTVGGALPFVLVNRKGHNNYPDKLSSNAHRPVGLNYMPNDDRSDAGFTRIGVSSGRGGAVEPQFSLRWQQEEFEQDAPVRWYAHWAEPMQLTAIQQGILDRTNEFRAEEGSAPLLPALRGIYGGPADFVLNQMQKKSVQVHEHPDFEPGYVLFDDRVFDRAANLRITGAREILATAAPIVGETPYATGRRLADIWRTSTLHYAAMVADDYRGVYGDLDYVGFAHIAAGRGTTAFYEDTYADAILPVEPPVTGTQAAQVFYGTDRLLAVFNAYWRGAAGAVSWYAPTSCKYGYIHLDFEIDGSGWDAWSSRRSNVAIKGRIRPVHLRTDPPTLRAAIGAALCFVDGVLRLRVCTINAAKLIQIWDGPAWAGWGEFSAIASFDPTTAHEDAEGAMTVGYPIFSASGARCVIPLTRRVFHTGPALRQSQVNFSATPDGTAMVVGSVIDFVEWTSTGFERVHRSSINITPTTISTSSGRNDYVETCEGSYRWLADYSGDELVYATVTLANSVEQYSEYTFAGGDYITLDRPEVTEQNTVVTLLQTVTFPNGSELIATNATITNWRATGFVLCLHTLDILHPDKTAYSRQDLSNVSEMDNSPSVALSLHWNGDEIKSKPESTRGADGPLMPPDIWFDGCSWGGGIARMQAWRMTLYSSVWYFAYTHPIGLAYDTPASGSAAASPLPAQGWGDRTQDAYPADIGTFGNVNRTVVHAASSVTSAVAPILNIRVYDSDLTQVDLGMWEYSGEWILSGRYVNPIKEFPEFGFWEPEADRRLWRATFDLAGAVGYPLGNNIEPVGVV